MVIEGDHCGFFANFTQVIRKLSNYNGIDNLYVDWNKHNSLYYDVNYGENVWEYYFENFSTFKDSDIYNGYIELKLLENSNFRQTFNFLYSKYIKLKDNVKNEFNIINNEFFINKKVLGIHIRNTDKFMGHLHGEPMGIPVNNGLFKKHIDEIVDNFDYIYLATDSINTFNEIVNIYGDKIIKTNRFMSLDETPIHHANHNISGYKKGLDVLLDVLHLSKCEYLIRSTSNVSSTSMFINTNLECLNLNEIYLNDKREHDFNIISKRYNANR